jgi:hypothetical protein
MNMNQGLLPSQLSSINPPPNPSTSARTNDIPIVLN